MQYSTFSTSVHLLHTVRTVHTPSFFLRSDPKKVLPVLNWGYIFALPVERHMVYFLQTDTEIVIIRILSQHQDTGRHFNWH